MTGAERGDASDFVFWTPVELAQHLRLKNPNTIGQMIHDGKITEADGWFKVGRLNRFIRLVVLERCRQGRFAKGLDENGHPIPPRRKQQT